MILLSNKIGQHPIINECWLNNEQISMIEKDFQKNDRLVYCDLLEHLLLHLKIMENPNPLISNIRVGYGGAINFIIPELNDIFSGIQYKMKWKQEVIKKVIDRFDDYLLLLKFGWKNLKLILKSIWQPYFLMQPSGEV